ncbi:kinase-like domain-containing protein [Thermothelomyces heterothallicus CBS 202.75]|uniref:kinase-like domain-containing protein n=1 Tax=Thermothelomyces heterothallicus CBS 202.75 TaxID=1149848 RepID=UPI0037436C31
MSDEIHFPIGFGLKDLVAWGNTGMILLDKSTTPNTVIKTPHDSDSSISITREQQIYERFHQRGGHKGILRYYGTFESAIRLEYTPRSNLRSYLSKHAVDTSVKVRWAVQIAEALEFAHQSGVIHGDINGYNVFLNESLDAKLGDYAGSSLDGSPLLVSVTPSHRCPRSTLSVEGDLFALGSVLYELMSGSPPYAGLSDEEIFACYAKGEFPDTTSLVLLGSIITRCWQGQYKECGQVICDLKAAQRKTHSWSANSIFPA